MIFDKEKVRSNFNRHSPIYNSNAILQKSVAKSLFNLAKNDILSAKIIADFGAGTGFVAENILKEFGEKEIYQIDISEKMLEQNPFKTPKIIADIENLPKFDQAFDLATSSLTLQWVNDLEKTIKSILNNLKNGGVFVFSTLGNDSLQELKSACKTCQIKLAINDFIQKNYLEKILQGLNYELKSQNIILDYKNLYELLKSIKSIGAGYSSNKNFVSKDHFELLNSFYLKNFNLSNRVFATWQVLFILIRKQ